MGTVIDLIAGLRHFKCGFANASPRWKEGGVSKVIVCGASGSGKTTIVNMVRRSHLNRSGAIGIPRRFVTRPLRENDDLEENIHLTSADFDARANEMRFSWRRRFSARRVERYGFELAPDAIVELYSANNALFDDRQPESVKRAIAETFVLGITANPHVRYERFKARNPALLCDQEEMEHRFSTPEAPIITWSHAVLSTDEVSLNELEAEALIFFSRILSARRRALGL